MPVWLYACIHVYVYRWSAIGKTSVGVQCAHQPIQSSSSASCFEILDLAVCSKQGLDRGCLAAADQAATAARAASAGTAVIFLISLLQIITPN